VVIACTEAAGGNVFGATGCLVAKLGALGAERDVESVSNRADSYSDIQRVIFEKNLLADFWGYTDDCANKVFRLVGENNVKYFIGVL